MELNKIYVGDNIESLRAMPDKCIDCCITSPPYYALRDYGTGTWVGGDPNCEHKNAELSSRFIRTMTDTSVKQKTNIGSDVREYVRVCPDCGAVREDKQVGLEETPEEYVDRLVTIFREVKRVLKDEGTLWLNIGDSYYGSVGGRGTDYHDSRTDVVQSGNKGFNDMKFAPVLTKKHEVLKPKDIIGIPWLLAFALRADGWYLRQDIIWHKPNPMPESVKDRCTKSHEYIFLLSKSPKYYFDHEAMQEKADPKNEARYKCAFNVGKEQENFRPDSAPNTAGLKEYTGMRNKRDVWTVNPAHYKEAHFATFPEELIFPMVLAGCPKGGVVLDPFMGSGTTAVVAKRENRNYVGCELNEEYVKMAENRIKNTTRRLF